MDSSHGTSVDTLAGSPVSWGPGPRRPIEVAQEAVSRRRPKWLTNTLREAERVDPPRTTFRESIPPERFCSYIALVTGITDSKPSSFDEASRQQVWRDAMVEEYPSIMQNDVWKVVP